MATKPPTSIDNCSIHGLSEPSFASLAGTILYLALESSWSLWDHPFHKKPWHGTGRKPWGNGVEPWEKVVEPWRKRWNREKSSARLWGTLFWLLHRFISGCHQKNHSLYHSSYAWFLAMLPGSYWTSRWGPVTYETSPQEVLGYAIMD